MSNQIPKELSALYDEFDNCERCREENNPFLHVLGGGKFRNPKFLFLFINPTYLNISSHRDYGGKRRYPFVGVRYFYRLLSEAGFVEKEIIKEIYQRGWQIGDDNRIEQSLVKNKVYITNLVKCTQSHPQNPSKKVIRKNFSLLEKEINIVSPRYIVAFGTLVFKILTNKNILLRDCLKKLDNNDYEFFQSIDILGKKYNVFPCYFPVGRGNPTGALKILEYVKQEYSN